MKIHGLVAGINAAAIAMCVCVCTRFLFVLNALIVCERVWVSVVSRSDHGAQPTHVQGVRMKELTIETKTKGSGDARSIFPSEAMCMPNMLIGWCGSIQQTMRAKSVACLMVLDDFKHAPKYFPSLVNGTHSVVCCSIVGAAPPRLPPVSTNGFRIKQTTSTNYSNEPRSNAQICLAGVVRMELRKIEQAD